MGERRPLSMIIYLHIHLKLHLFLFIYLVFNCRWLGLIYHWKWALIDGGTGSYLPPLSKTSLCNGDYRPFCESSCCGYALFTHHFSLHIFSSYQLIQELISAAIHFICMHIIHLFAAHLRAYLTNNCPHKLLFLANISPLFALQFAL